MKASVYMDTISRMERAYRHFLDVVNVEIQRSGVHDINNVQALMLFNVGDAEITVSELTSRGCYLETHVLYNAKKMVQNGYLVTERFIDDLRSTHVKLTDKGRTLRDRLSAMYQRHIRIIDQAGITEPDLRHATAILEQLQRFWTGASDPYLQKHDDQGKRAARA